MELDAFPENLRELRTKVGLSQAALSRLSGISQARISQWESGDGDPAMRQVVKLTECLGCTMEQLFASRPKRGRPRKSD